MTRSATVLLVVLFGLAAVAAVQPAMAKGSKGPTGWQIFCLAQSQECVGGGAKQVEATDDAMSRIKHINTSVNRAIKPRRDGKLDVWSINVSAGDCEDYALTKRSKLIKSGFPASALRIAQVKTTKGEGHAVLVIQTSRGRFVLDNLTDAIRPLSQTRYRVVSIQTANPKVWSSKDAVTGRTAAALFR